MTKACKIDTKHETKDAFLKTKEELKAMTTLSLTTPDSTTLISVDSSDTGNDSCSSTFSHSILSKKFSADEKKYNAFDREFLAIYQTLRYFFIVGQKFHIYIDH